MLNVHVVVRSVGSADEGYLERLAGALERRGAEGVAVVHYPEDSELAIVFDIEEEALGGLLEPGADRAAA